MRIRRTGSGWALVRNIRGVEGERLRVLQVGGVFQSATYVGELRFELPFEYYRAIARAVEDVCRCASLRKGACEDCSPFHVLFLGGGGCSVPKHLVRKNEAMHIDVVEIDPAIVDIARRFFYLGEAERTGRLKTHVCDGLDFLGNGGPGYDVIVNDAFDGEAPAGELLDDAAIELAGSRLKAGGAYVLNFVCAQDSEGEGRLNEMLSRLMAHFKHVRIIPASDESYSDCDNFILVGSDQAIDFNNAIDF